MSAHIQLEKTRGKLPGTSGRTERARNARSGRSRVWIGKSDLALRCRGQCESHVARAYDRDKEMASRPKQPDAYSTRADASLSPIPIKHPARRRNPALLSLHPTHTHILLVAAHSPHTHPHSKYPSPCSRSISKLTALRPYLQQLYPHTTLTMPAKKRCQFESETRCNSAALRIVGQCPHCRVEFCGTVRTSLCFSCVGAVAHVFLPLAAPYAGTPQLPESGQL